MSWIKQFMAATEQAAEETATVSLGCARCEVSDHPANLAEMKHGSFISLVGDEVQAEIGVVTSEAGSRELTCRLLGSEPETPEDEADALGEIANIIAGGAKRRLGESNHKVKLGLPLCFKGEIYFKEPVEITTRSCVWGDTPVLLIVIVRQENDRPV